MGAARAAFSLCLKTFQIKAGGRLTAQLSTTSPLVERGGLSPSHFYQELKLLLHTDTAMLTQRGLNY